ncbi:MAG: hypothetical protein WCZ47_04435 [Bacilli bacterium]|jgi:O-antigen/teichoic acid export membrane protein|nr:hypothetical protein [Bacilli bacterium]
MTRKKALRNIITSVLTKSITIVLMLFAQRALIKNIGNEANGLYSLFASVIGFLSVAELGIGSAITFSMYEPVANGKKDVVSAIYKIYKKIYFIVGAIILVAGVGIMFAVPYLASDESGIFNIRLNFLIYLLSVVLTYTFHFKKSFIGAFRDNYKNDITLFVGKVVQVLIQVIVSRYYNLLEIYVFALFIGNLVESLLTHIVFAKKYKSFLTNNTILEKVVKQDIIKRIKAMFMHKIGGLLVSTLNGIVISAVISVVILGYYSNYVLITAGLSSVIILLFSSLTSVVGHLFVKKDSETMYKYFKTFYILNYFIGFLFFLGFLAIGDQLVSLLFGPQLVMERYFIIALTLTTFTTFMRQSSLLFKDAAGNFYYDRYKPLYEGIINIALSLLFVHFFGVVGVLIATILTNLFICHIVEPYIVFKYSLKMSSKKYYLINYSLVLLFGLTIIIFELINFSIENLYLDILANGFLSVVVTCVVSIFLYLISPTIRESLKLIKDNFLPKKRKENLPNAHD